MNKNIFDTGEYINQNGKRFPILFEVIIEQDEIIIYIPIPDGYSKTSLTDMYDIFGMASISYTENFGIYLGELYIYPQLYSKLATDYEKRAFRGIGKRMLCFALEYMLFNILKYKYSDIIDKYIYLFAQGGQTCENINEINKIYTFRELEEYFSKYTTDRRIKTLIESKNKIALQDIMCYINQNKKLAKYYNKFGFRLVHYDDRNKQNQRLLTVIDKNMDQHMYIMLDYKSAKITPTISFQMKAKIIDVLHNCKNNSANNYTRKTKTGS